MPELRARVRLRKRHYRRLMVPEAFDTLARASRGTLTESDHEDPEWWTFRYAFQSRRSLARFTGLVAETMGYATCHPE